jgi:hypothetical protein
VVDDKMAKRKGKFRSRHQSGIKKIMKGLAYGVADAFIIAPAAIPAITVANEIVNGHTVRYAVNTATQMVAGISVDGGDMKPDWTKLVAYSVGSIGLVAVGLGMRKYIAKRV